MHKQKQILYFIATTLITTCATSAKIDPEPNKLPVLVIPGEVTIDGIPRPDLGRAFSDSISGSLLKTKAFTIIDYISKSSQGQEIKRETAVQHFIPEFTIEQSVGKTAALYAFIPRMIAEEDYFRLSIKKLRVSDREIINVYEASTVSPESSAMFELLNSAIRLVMLDVYREKLHQSKSKRRGVIEMEIPKIRPALDPKSPKPNSKPAPKTLAIEPPAHLSSSNNQPPSTEENKISAETETKKTNESVEKEKEAEYAGRVRAVNIEWHFCIIESAQADTLQVNDELIVSPSSPVKPIGKLRISKVEGNQIVADAQGDIALSGVKPGFKVFTWKVAED